MTHDEFEKRLDSIFLRLWKGRTTMTTNEQWIDELLKLINEYGRGWDVGCPEPSEEDIKQVILQKLQEEYKRGFIEGGITAINTPYKGQV